MSVLPLLSLLAQEAGGKEYQFFEPGSSLWMPPQASDHAASTDAVFYFIYWVSVFFFVLILALMIFFVVRFRRRQEGQPAQAKITHSTPLEVTWTVIPLILVIIMFVAGFRGFVAMDTPPANATQIIATGYKWYWLFQYPNGHVDRELHLEVDRPYKLLLTSNDVTHSLFIPAFRVKRDAVPGRFTQAWFTPTQTGEFRLFCAEYCGTQHSTMVSRVVVHERGRWQVWLNEASDPFKTRTLAEVGALLYSGKGGCNGCHTIDGTRYVGPSFRNIYGHAAELTDGRTVVVDENYIRESILDPNAQVVKGYQPVMNSYKGLLSDREILALIEFIKSLSDDYVPPVEEPAEPAAEEAADDAAVEAEQP
jgi:cytochrome c oxidase subunit 2